MAFYLRKYFGAGPLRLNISKGGLGVSGGVKGARVGVGPKGAYVHGGRHGLYYRKYAKGKVGDAGRLPGRGVEEASFFIDTGLTYNVRKLGGARKFPESPLLPGHSRLANAMLVGGFLMALLWFGMQDYVFLTAGFVLLGGGVALNTNHHKHREKARKLVERIEEGLEKRENVKALIQLQGTGDIRKAYRPWADYHIFAMFLDAFYEDPDYILPFELGELESQLSVSRELIRLLKADVYSEFLDELIEDHMLTKQEEENLEQLQLALGIDDDDIERERYQIEQLSLLRDSSEGPLEELKIPALPKGGEKCYYAGYGRLLREKIIRQYQRQLVRYKEIGYDIDMEGDIYLSDDRILIAGRGSRSYSLDRIMDITISIEDNTVQLVIDGRKNPLVFSMPDVPVFAGKLLRLTAYVRKE